jgi:Uncharacterized protein conserved in bacteria
MPLSVFIVEAAEERAARVLSEKTAFVIDPHRWELFSAALDRPAIDNASLRRLLESPGVFEEA